MTMNNSMSNLNIGGLSRQDFRKLLQEEDRNEEKFSSRHEKYFSLDSTESILQDIIIYDRADLIQECITIHSEWFYRLLHSTRTIKKQSIFHLATSSSSIRILRLLHDIFSPEKAETSVVNDQTIWGETALHLATGIGNSEIVKSLLEWRIDQGLKDNWGRTAADIAKETGHSTLFQTTSLSTVFLTRIEEDRSINHLQESSIPRQVLATEFMQKLQQKKRQPTDETALSTPTVIVKTIFSEQVEPVAAAPIILPLLTVNRRLTAISKLIEYPGDPEQLARLCAAENFETYDVNGKDMYGLAAIHKISSWNKTDLLTILLAHPLIDINLPAAASQSNYTALHFAIENHTTNTFQLLLQQSSIRVDLADIKGRTPLKLAEELHISSFIEHLLLKSKNDI